MSSRTILEATAPVTQAVDALVELLNTIGKPSCPIPETVELPGAMLVLSSKRDSYYVVTAKTCSCPSAIYRHKLTCKHRKRYLAVVRAAQDAASDECDTLMTRNAGSWYGGHNGPVEPEEVQ